MAGRRASSRKCSQETLTRPTSHSATSNLQVALFSSSSPRWIMHDKAFGEGGGSKHVGRRSTHDRLPSLCTSLANAITIGLAGSTSYFGLRLLNRLGAGEEIAIARGSFTTVTTNLNEISMVGSSATMVISELNSSIEQIYYAAMASHKLPRSFYCGVSRGQARAWHHRPS